MVKGFGVGFDEVLYGMSYANIVLYSASLPTYRGKGEKDDEVIQGDDPRNKERLRAILFNS